jgi:predicted Zn-dependent protease
VPFLRFVLAVLFLGALAATAQAQGIDVGKPSSLRQLVPAGAIEQQAARQYADLKRQAAAKNALGTPQNAQVRRLRGIAERIIPQSVRYNPRAKDWNWEINLIRSNQINAFCMPGGKIAFYSGILESLKLSDDEVAMVMGHEMAHALREHAREQAAKGELTRLGATMLGDMVGGGRYSGLFSAGGNLLTLRFSRDDESEADLVGLDLAARSGYDPRAGVTLWQKMAASHNGAPPQWLSTHPSGQNRIKEIEKHLPQVMPIYLEATRQPH